MTIEGILKGSVDVALNTKMIHSFDNLPKSLEMVGKLANELGAYKKGITIEKAKEAVDGCLGGVFLWQLQKDLDGKFKDEGGFIKAWDEAVKLLEIINDVGDVDAQL
jgi:hypothetical protein